MTSEEQEQTGICTCDMPDGTGYCAVHDADDWDLDWRNGS